MTIKQRARVFDAFDRWGFDVKGWSQKTRVDYFGWASRSDAWLVKHRNTNLVAAEQQDIKAYIWSLPANASTRNHARQALINFGEFMVEQGLAREIAAANIPRLPEPEPIPKALSRQNALAIRGAARRLGPMLDALVTVFLFCALRHQEARTLEWRNVDLEDGYVRFWGKGGKEASVPLHPEAIRTLLGWRDACPSPQWVFPSPRDPGRTVSKTWVQTHIRLVGDAAGVLELHPHKLRHTTATRLIERGADIMTVKEFMRHSSVSTTQRYLRVRNPRVREAATRLDF